MKYKLVERGNPTDKTAEKKLYATPVYSGKVTKRVRHCEVRSNLRQHGKNKVFRHSFKQISVYKFEI